jgi:hypothetical protein
MELTNMKWKRLPDEELKHLRNVLPKLSAEELLNLKRVITILIREDFKDRHYEPVIVPAKAVAAAYNADGTLKRKGFIRKEFTKILGFEIETGSVLEAKILSLFTPEVRIRLGLRDGKILSQNELGGVELRTQTSEKRPGIKGQKGQSIQLTCIDEVTGGLPLDKTRVSVLTVKLPLDPQQGIFRNPKAPQK